jgi:hypothetical protein
VARLGETVKRFMEMNIGLASMVDKLMADVKSLNSQHQALKKLAFSNGWSEASYKDLVNQINIEEFDKQTAAEDVRDGVEDAGSEPAAYGMIAILGLDTTFNGQIDPQQSALRVRKVLNGTELAEDLEKLVLGMKAGEERSGDVKDGDKTYQVKVKLYGLRKVKPAEVKAPEAPTADEASK